MKISRRGFVFGLPLFVAGCSAGSDFSNYSARPDERHIRAADVHELAALVQQWPEAEYNLEGNPFHNLMVFVAAVRGLRETGS